MLKELNISNFTLFPDTKLGFGRGVNLFTGENGTGKSHILKLAYCLASVLNKNGEMPDAPTKEHLKKAIALKLRRVFLPDTIGSLVCKQGSNRTDISCSLEAARDNLEFSFSTSSRTEVAIQSLPDKWLEKHPVFIPTRELMSIYPNFVSIYDTTEGLEIESTWRDTCLLLGALEKRGSKEQTIRKLLQPLEEAMGGGITLDKGGRFYLKLPSGKMEMHLIAEGLRKLAMIARLIASGSLSDKGCLFWDEPEANLNPRIVKQVANTILHLAQNGIQVFVATHSLFLMREIYILQQQLNKPLDARFFGLHRVGATVEVTSGQTMDDVGDIVSLDEELLQSERYLDLDNHLSES